MEEFSEEDWQLFGQLCARAFHQFCYQVGTHIGNAISNSNNNTQNIHTITRSTPHVQQQKVTHNTAPSVHHSQAKPKPSPKTTQTINHSTPPPSEAETVSASTSVLWINGDTQLNLTSDCMHNGKPHTGWVFVQSCIKNFPRNGFKRRYYFCFGVFKCLHCNFLARPPIPKERKKRSRTPTSQGTLPSSSQFPTGLASLWDITQHAL